MKIQNEVMADGRIILHLKENDGTLIAMKELLPRQAAGLMARWALAVMKEQNEPTIIIEERQGKCEIVISLRESPKPKETESK